MFALTEAMTKTTAIMTTTMTTTTTTTMMMMMMILTALRGRALEQGVDL
jgi:hypothetical protein